MRLQTKLIPEVITYDGKQLSPHFILQKSGLMGDALVAFIGPAHVQITEMVDEQDVIENSPIYSPMMLHFIGEFFHTPLLQGVFLQRLFMATLKDLLMSLILPSPASNTVISRDGDDLMCGPQKLSVSIVTQSPVSCLLHTGLNIDDKGTPVKTTSLNKLQIDAPNFAKQALALFAQEYEEIYLASCKVRPIIN